MPDLSRLTRLSAGVSRAISPKNFSGQPGAGGMATEGTGASAARDLGPGWKVSPSVSVGPGETFTLADIGGSGAIQSMWFTGRPLSRDWILRAYWDDQPSPSATDAREPLAGCHRVLLPDQLLAVRRGRRGCLLPCSVSSRQSTAVQRRLYRARRGQRQGALRRHVPGSRRDQ